MLVKQVIDDMTAAMKNQEKFKLSVLRMLKSALQMEKINKKHDLTDEEALSIIKKQVKIRKDSIVEFTKYDKKDEIEKLNNEIEILSVYLPEELSEQEIDKFIEQAFDEIKPSGNKDLGRVIKRTGELTKGCADMSIISQKVRQRLNKED